VSTAFADEPWTCPCGHELTAAGECVVWTKDGEMHVVPKVRGWRGRVCSCHGRDVIADEWRRS
jgi:hypothetical protein